MLIRSHPSESEQAFCSLATRASPYSQLTTALSSLLCCSHRACFSVAQIILPPTTITFALHQWSPTFLAPETSFPEDNFFHGSGERRFQEDSSAFCLLHFILLYQFCLPWLPRWHSGREPTCQRRRHGLDSWARRIPWRRPRQPTPAFFARKIPWRRPRQPTPGFFARRIPWRRAQHSLQDSLPGGSHGRRQPMASQRVGDHSARIHTCTQSSTLEHQARHPRGWGPRSTPYL